MEPVIYAAIGIGANLVIFLLGYFVTKVMCLLEKSDFPVVFLFIFI